ncbi:pleckstrin homology domain-containing family B member 2-like [Lineus longissimus]|uniref:pleckstrin homology domain-containing family B member 2-like n=1 Tax=Lineus longissimus TaxID=88925 RepID=UPI002B4C9FA2
MAMDIAKAGWLHRQSTFLLRWKKVWFVLYTNGDLKYFKSPDVFEAEATLRMKTECLTIQTGRACGVSPPDGASRDALLAVVGRSETWQLCGENPDDAKAWQFSLEQARVINVRPAFKPPTGNPNQPPAYPTGPPPPYSQGQPYPQGSSPQQVQGSAYPTQRVVYAYPGQRYYGSHPPPYVVQEADGSRTTVIYQNAPEYHNRYDGGDVAMGMMAGAALGTMMWSPLLFW